MLLAYVAIMPLRKVPWMVHLYRRQLTHDGGMARVWRVSMFPHSSGVFVPLGTLMQQPTLRKNKFVLYSPHIVVFFCFRLKGKYKRLGRNSAHTSDVVQSHQGASCVHFTLFVFFFHYKGLGWNTRVGYLVFHPFSV